MIKYVWIAGMVFLISMGANAQGGTPAQQLAAHIADRMKDSLSLTAAQRGQIFSINMRMHNDKMAKRGLYGNRDSVGRHLQLIENSRDSLYHKVLSEAQYGLYLKKKGRLLGN